jgi:O-antigen/teichoic acid export membrane protein
LQNSSLDNASGQPQPAVAGISSRARLAGHGTIYIGAAIANSAIPFLLLPLLTRWLGPADFGVVGIFVALVNVLGAVVGLSSHGLISVVYYREGPGALPAQVGASLGIVAASSVAVMIFLWAARDVISAGTGVTSGMLWTIAVASAGQFVVTICLTVFQTRQKPFSYAAIQLGYAAALAVATIVLVGLAGLGWEGRALAQVCAASLLAAAGLLWLSLARDIDWSVRRWRLRDALSFGLPLLPHGIAAVSMASIDRVALGSAVSPAGIGYYYLAVQIGTLITVCATALNQAWLPWLYEKLAREDAEADREVVRAVYVIFALTVTGAAGLALLAPILIPLVAGPGYEPATLLLMILAPAFAFNGMYFFVSGFLFFERRTGLLAAITVSVAALQAMMSFAFAHWGGAVGVAWATFASFFLYFVSVWVASQRVHAMPWTGTAIRP